MRIGRSTASGKDLRCFDQSKREDASWRFLLLCQTGARKNQIFPARHIGIAAILLVEDPELARQTAEDHLVKSIVHELFQIDLAGVGTARFLADIPEVFGQIPPFADPAEIQIVLLRELSERLIGGFAFQRKPEIQDPDEIGFLGEKFPVRGIRFICFFERSFPRIGDAEECGDHEHFRKDLLFMRFEKHFPELGINRHHGKTASGWGQARSIQCADIVQGPHSFADQDRRRFIDQRKCSERREIQRSHLQNDSGKRGTLDLGRREFRALFQLLFRIKMNTDPVPQSSAATPALTRACLGDEFHPQFLNACARIVSAQPHQSGIDHIADSRNGQRSFRNIGCQDDPARTRRQEDPFLILGGKPTEQRQNGSPAQIASGKHLRAVPDFPFPGQEHQNIPAGIQFVQEFDAAGDGLRQFLLFFRGEVDILNGKEPSFDLFDRAVPEKSRDPVRFQRCGGDQKFQIGSFFEQKLEVSEKKIDIEGVFMHLIQNDAVILQEQGIGTCFRKQDPIGHEFDDRGGGSRIIEPDFASDLFPVTAVEFVRDSCGERGCRNTARLCASDAPFSAESGGKSDLRELGRFSGTS